MADAPVSQVPVRAPLVVEVSPARDRRRQRALEDDLPHRRSRSYSSRRRGESDRTDSFRVRVRELKVEHLDTVKVDALIASRKRAQLTQPVRRTARAFVEVTAAVGVGVLGALVVAFVLMVFFGPQ